MAITKRTVKGAALTHVELDANFTTLEAADDALTASIASLTSGAVATAQAAADAAQSNIDSHEALSIAHGVSGSVVGTTDTQTLTNKTLVAASNTITTAASGNLAATELNAALAELQGDVDTRSTTAALAADSGTSLVGFLQSGTGAVARTAQDKGRDSLCVFDFMTAAQVADVKAGAGSIDVAAALQSAITEAIASGRGLYAPAGTYLLNTTVTAASAIHLHGDGIGDTTFRAGMTDGSVCLQFQGQFQRLENFSVAGNVNAANFIAGTADGVNCTGIALGDASNYCNRWHISSVRVYGCKKGWYVRGFIGTADNLWADYNELGFDAYEINSTDLNLRFENNRKDFSILKGDSILLRQLLQEGYAAAPVASTIDDVNGIELAQPYWEGGSATGRNVPWVIFGGATLVRRVDIRGGKCVASGDFGYTAHGLKLDNVDGADVDVFFATGDRNSSVQTTANTKNYRNNSVQLIYGWLHDSSKQLGPAFNYWPNRAFDVWLRGWNTVLPTRATLSQETTIVRKGNNALRITADAGAGFNVCEMRITGPSMTYLRGKSVQFGAWIWVPDIAAFQKPTNTALASINSASYNGSVNLVSATQNNYFKAGEWNFFVSAPLTVQADATRLSINIYVNQSSATVDGSEFVVVDSILLTESTTPMERMINDDLIDSPMIDCTFNGGCMVYRADAVPTDTRQTFGTGDRVAKITPAAGGSPGWVCTTGGAGGTAVFKAESNLAA